MVGINIVGTKYLVPTVPILFILTARFLFAAVVLFLLHWLTDHHRRPVQRHLEKLSKKDWIYLIAQALTAGVLFNCFMILGLRYTNANVAGIITSALPAIIAVMSWVILKEQFSRKKSLCVGLATIGLIIIGMDKLLGGIAHQSILGNLLIVLSLIPEAGYYILSKMHSNPLPIFLVSAVINSINALVLLPILLLQMNWHILHLASFDWLVLIIISIGSALFFVFWYLGSSRVDSVMASLSTAVMPIATVVVAWAALGEVITFMQFMGMALVMASIFAYTLK